MEFTFVTTYNQTAMTAMARTLRKTIRKKHSRFSHIVGWIVIALSLFLSLPFREDDFEISPRVVLTWGIVVFLLLVLVKEDAINGYFARKRTLPHLLTSTTVFSADGYHSSTEVGSSDFHYNNIIALAETPNYFVFIFSKTHAQVYDKSSITGGTVDDFRNFIQDITGQHIQKIS